MLINIIGRPGAGKTLFAVRECLRLTALHHLTIHANIHLKQIPYTELSLSALVNNKIDNSIVLIDEAYKYIHARQSGSHSNIAMATVLFQSRKTSNILILTEQIQRSIDLYYRSLIDIQILCENFITYYQYTYQFIEANTVKIFRIPVNKASRYYQYYDTNEFVNNDDQSSQQKIQLEFMNPDEREEYLNHIIDELRTKYDKKITLNNIKHYLFINKLNASLASIIKGRISSKDVNL